MYSVRSTDVMGIATSHFPECCVYEFDEPQLLDEAEDLLHIT